MAVSGKAFQDTFYNLWARLIGKERIFPFTSEELTLRSELFSADQMERHGKNLASAHLLKSGHPRNTLLSRLGENEELLLDVHGLLTEDVRLGRRITPAGEWLLDNFYLVEDQIRTAKRHLPERYSRALPHLVKGPSAGLPRVYDIALEVIFHGDGRVDQEILHRFVTAYQSVTPLTLGELWAIPIMLRLALIENFRRVTGRIAAQRIDRNRAGHWADQMSEIAAKDPKSLILVIADMARSTPPLVRSFVAELARRLTGQGAALALPLTWMEQILSESNLTIEQLVRAENQQQTIDQVSMSNSFASLRFLGAMDWRAFVESRSDVEHILSTDPSDVYRKMDFSTRDRYRHVVERLAKHSRRSERDVALNAIQFAQAGAARKGTDDRTAHVGYYLIDKGLPRLERQVKVRRSLAEGIRTAGRRVPLLIYSGTLSLVTLIFAAGLGTKAWADGVRGWPLGGIGLLAYLCASHLTIALVNRAVPWLTTPRRLPRMDFSKGIPPECRTVVVIPTLLTSLQNTDDLAKALEVRFLANRDENLAFALLTDGSDANTEKRPEDEPLVQRARDRINELNKKYRREKGDVFFLFHRPRQWNPNDQTWMGHERKRGKLADFNGFLRGGARDRFALIVGDTASLVNVAYVLTLDTDTQLPRDSARACVGAMAHPLNRPLYDDKRGRVVAGYGILQPRVTGSLSGAHRSMYARLCAQDLGIDPYTRAVSDVYQDLFGEGSFIGKGIYDVDVFERALRGRFPDNRILSHDLLEGCYARAGLLSDVQWYDDCPSRYKDDVARRYRWIRGDWQIAQWAMPRVPGPDGRLEKNPLSLLSRWKILDNLRRSLTAPALTFLLLLSWTVLPSASFWTLSVIGILFIPSVLGSVIGAFQKTSDVTWAQHVAAVGRSSAHQYAETLFTLSCLPYEAYFSLDAAARSLWRTRVTRQHMLDWNPSGGAHADRRVDLLDSYRTMWVSPFVAVLAAMGIFLFSPPGGATIAGPLLSLWMAVPAIVWWIGRPLVRPRAKLTASQNIFLRTIARKTWFFFETFVGPADHGLPPDNYQEHPVAAIAHRTSPTNMGLALLANLTAYDFGYISAGRLLDRTATALATMALLERHRGHFYNWYDTQSLKPLRPLYVSSVDSGNLAGHLLTLRPGLLALPDQKIFGERFFEGLNDTLRVLQDAAPPDGFASARIPLLQQAVASAMASPPATIEAARECVNRLASAAADVLADRAAQTADPDHPWIGWAKAFFAQCQDAQDELTFLAPPGGRLTSEQGNVDPAIPTLRALAKGGGLFPSANAAARMATLQSLATQCDALAQMEYAFLYNESRHLLSIGYDVENHRRDASDYDLLASEARFSCFVGIAQGKMPQESWFALGRLLTTAEGRPLLLSWSGSMFEYLMPLLVMPTYPHTLLNETYRTVVARQRAYGDTRGVPWGVSESGYNGFDVHLNYQYRAFGVPGLGLKRGLAEELVIAPYATALALMVEPEAACSNLERLSAAGMESQYGFYEAMDYTPSRLPRGHSSAVVRSFMAHHQGMSFLAMAHVLLHRPMQKRFASDPLFQATLLLLQEKIPKATAAYAHTTEISETTPGPSAPEMPLRVFTHPHTPTPEVHLLSNGRYHVMITAAGGGYSRWKNLAVTRWREDSTRDPWGTFVFLRDVASGECWSTAYQPTLKRPQQYEAIFSEGRAEFRVRTHEYDCYTEIAVSPEDDIELRRVRLTNRARTRRTVEVTSYAEVVLAPPATDALHPAFSNLFVQTEIVRPRGAILCTRRPSVQGDAEPWLFHRMAVYGGAGGDLSYETDRLRFLGRGNTANDPQAMNGTGDDSAGKLSDRDGSVLDPIVAIRVRITLDPDESATIHVVSGVGETRDAAMTLVEKYQDQGLADRVFPLAWAHGQVLLRQIDLSETEAQMCGRLASSILYSHGARRADPSVLIRNQRGQSSLWGYALSGDLPLVLVQIEDPAHLELVRQLVKAHAYWRLKGLAVDLVIWNKDHSGYRQILHDQITGLIGADIGANVTNRPGGIFVRAVDQIADEDRVLIQSVARVILSDARGSLADQINGRGPVKTNIPLLIPTRPLRPPAPPPAPSPRHDLSFNNGLGGFTPDGREYVISTGQSQRTPAPWVNVLANPSFGTVVSESGLGYTWSENAHEFRLTPWGNDPVSDSSGEALYLRDEERGHVWSPTPYPCRGTTPYVTRHGFGYSVFEHTEHGIRSELWVYTALDAPIKFSVLKLKNVSARPRRISATGYVEWVLGDLPPKSTPHVVTDIDSETGSIFARNAYNTEFPNRTAFFDVDDSPFTLTGDRTEFVGRNGTLRAPAALLRERLSGRVGAGLDPCAAIHVPVDLAPGQERDIIFRLGIGRDAGEARNLIRRFRGSTAARTVLDQVWAHWTHTLGVVQVETPDAALNILANGWLLYQTLACRLWARSATYQSGGAFGFRDQLQDVMALIDANPQLVRDHLLLCAAHQFTKGDVQHWWHPPHNRGVRTHCSDDALWLPLAACRYVLSTGDIGVWDEPVHFLEGRPLKAEEESYYDLPTRSEESARLYDHCVRVLLNSLTFGAHGLPLIGSGDWNDGMNRVGKQGKGESVWLGFFLYGVLMRFAETARARNDGAFAARCEKEAAGLRIRLEEHGWDGEWYRRAYFDDGSPLGSATNVECQIDSISQSWSILSGAGDPERGRLAMEAVYRRLVRRDAGVIQLLDPPFNTSAVDPGYIRGYVPGVRENGGQYTHAAIWATMAFAQRGDARRAWELFSMINPITHGNSAEAIALYKVEPYVVAADVYAAPGLTGRGGWTWYTGSAAWMYRLIVESLLGFTRVGETLRFAPCLPADWTGFKMRYRHQDTVYHIEVKQTPEGHEAIPRTGIPRTEIFQLTLDSVDQPQKTIPLVNDRKEHWAEVVLVRTTV